MDIWTSPAFDSRRCGLLRLIASVDMSAFQQFEGHMVMTPTSPTHFLVASDFDQTLSFNDSGAVLSELIGASRFQEKVDGLARSNLVQQGGELAYLIRHDPEFRGVRREHLEETGPPRAAAQQHPRARRLSRARRRRAPVLVLRDLGGAARGHPVGARGHRRAGPHLRDRARVRRHTAKCGRSRACRRATARSPSSRSSRTSWASARIGRSTSATAAPTCT